MILNCLLNPLRLNADIPLCGSCAVMLKEPLHQCDVKPIGIVYLCGIPFTETVSADTLEAQVIAHDSQF